MDLQEVLKVIPPWVLAILLFIFVLVFLERVDISKKPVDTHGLTPVALGIKTQSPVAMCLCLLFPETPRTV